MQWLLIILALIFAIPSYGISIIVLLFLLPMIGKKTRGEIFPVLIRQAYQSGYEIQNEDVFFEAAARYARDNGGEMLSADSATFNTLINGEKVIVFFHKSHNGGIYIKAKKYEIKSLKDLWDAEGNPIPF
jgi:hypothetical protein